MRLYTCSIPDNIQRGRLENYLVKALPLLPASAIRDALKKRDVKIDGQRVGSDAETAPGAKVSLYSPFDAQLTVVYEDERVLLLNKPAGLSVQEDGLGGMTAESAAFERAKGAYIPRAVHRLDNQTCGLLLMAKDDVAEQTLIAAFRDHSLVKQYTCVVRGVMRPPAAVKDAYLIKDAARAKVRVITHATPGAKEIRTEYQTLRQDDATARLLVTLHTGRTHQIRAHLAFLGHPVLGDDLYGDRALNKRVGGRLLLCATHLSIGALEALPGLSGKEFDISAPF